MTGTLCGDQYTFLIISRSVLFRMRSVSDKICGGNENAHFMLSNLFSRKSCLFEIMCKNIVQLGGPQMAIWRMSIARWIPKATNPHSHM